MLILTCDVLEMRYFLMWTHWSQVIPSKWKGVSATTPNATKQQSQQGSFSININHQSQSTYSTTCPINTISISKYPFFFLFFFPTNVCVLIISLNIISLLLLFTVKRDCISRVSFSQYDFYIYDLMSYWDTNTSIKLSNIKTHSFSNILKEKEYKRICYISSNINIDLNVNYKIWL